ncbi:27811_t:CDS:2, partial [Dentiscutata erythropus]
LNKKFLSALISFPHPTLGSTGSRLLDGNSSYAESLELFLADFHNAESALLFNSGYVANLGFFSCVSQPGDAVIIDEYVHASIHDGLRMSRASLITAFKHNDVEHLKVKLTEAKQQIKEQNNIFVVVESLYSMGGDFAPLIEIDEILKPFNVYLIVDEAHSVGAYGNKGKGIVCELGLKHRVFARILTFNKAIASSG